MNYSDDGKTDCGDLNAGKSLQRMTATKSTYFKVNILDNKDQSTVFKHLLNTEL